MSNQFIWSYLIHLGDNMWGDYGPEYSGECIKTRPLKCEDKAWNELTDYIKSKNCCNTILIDVGEGIKYETYPEISAPGAWSKQKLSDEISRLRSMGFKVYPKLNFSSAHDKWMGIYSRMISTPQYYKFCKDVIDEVSELFGKPELFHLGMDEECYSVQEKSPLCIIRGNDLLWHDINYLFDITEKAGARPWIWADHVWHTKESRDAFLENASKEALYSNWYYGNFEHTHGYLFNSMSSYATLEENGFDQVPTGSNCNETIEFCRDNMKLTVEKCPKVISPERLKGFMMTSWIMTTEKGKERNFDAVDCMSEAFEYYYKNN